MGEFIAANDTYWDDWTTERLVEQGRDVPKRPCIWCLDLEVTVPKERENKQGYCKEHRRAYQRGERRPNAKTGVGRTPQPMCPRCDRAKPKAKGQGYCRDCARTYQKLRRAQKDPELHYRKPLWGPESS